MIAATDWRTGILGWLLWTCLWQGCGNPGTGAEKVAAYPPVPPFSRSDSLLISIDLRQLPDSFWANGTREIRIEYDHNFKRAKRYRGRPIRAVLATRVDLATINPDRYALTFLCHDGYRPSMPLRQVLDHRGYLVNQDLDAPAGQDWAPEQAEAYAPFCAVWEGVPYTDHSFAWPYGLVELQLTPQEDVFAAAYPRDTAYWAGFEVYRQQCMRCHSINLVGGTLGPEFNVPRNITEYWQKTHIWEYAKDPQSFRLHSKMYPIQELTPADFEQLYAYLRHMRAHKLSQ